MNKEYKRGQLLAKKMIREDRQKARFVREMLLKAKVACLQEEVPIQDFWLKEGFLEETRKLKLEWKITKSN